MKIGNVTIEGKAGLAPWPAWRTGSSATLQGLRRRLCGERDGQLQRAFLFQDRRTEELMALSPGEHPAAIQLFGDDPAVMAHAAQKALQFGPDVLDINMAAPRQR